MDLNHFECSVVCNYSCPRVVCCSLAKLCPTLCDPMSCSTKGFLVWTIFWSLLRLMSFESMMPPTIWSFVIPFFSCLQSFPASESFPMGWLFTSGGQSIGTSASASILPMNIQSWVPLGLIGLIPLLSKELSRVFSSTTIQKHQFFSAQASLCSNSYICTWLLEKS